MERSQILPVEVIPNIRSDAPIGPDHRERDGNSTRARITTHCPASIHQPTLWSFYGNDRWRLGDTEREGRGPLRQPGCRQSID